MYEMKLENGVEENLKEWQKSDQLANSIEQAAANKGVNINAVVTEENIKKLGGGAAITASTSIKLGVPLRGQEDPNWCGPACIQMISLYYGHPTPTQHSIYYYFPWKDPEPKSGLSPDDIVKWAKNKWGKTGTIDDSMTNSEIVTEIDKRRPFYSLITNPNHFRVCNGYLIQNGYFYIYINDPEPVGSSGTPKIELGSSQEKKRIYIR